MSNPQVPTLSERAARFAREALDPPPVPEKRVAWAGGPIITSDRREALLKLLVRKAAQGVALTADQQAQAAPAETRAQEDQEERREPRRESRPPRRDESGPKVVGMGDHLPGFIALSFDERRAG